MFIQEVADAARSGYVPSLSPVRLLLSYSVQLQHDEDSDMFSACWVILLFP